MGRRELKHISEVKYFGLELDESGTNGAESCREVATDRKIADAVRSPVNGNSLQLECARLLREGLIVPILRYRNESMPGEGKI